MAALATSTRSTRVAITLGDPAGVGPEILARALAEGKIPEGADYFVIGPARHLRAAIERLGVPVDLCVANGIESARKMIAESPQFIVVLEPKRDDAWPDVPLGRVCAEGGEAAFRSIELAIRLAMNGDIDAICTAPLHKKALRLAGHDYPGHTEILADLSGAERVVMLLQGGGLRVSMVTIHMALTETARHITEENVRTVVEITNDALRCDWGIETPRVAVTGYNPHAGDDGLFGCEEDAAIVPAIMAVREQGVDASGPWPADTVFHQMLQGRFDVIVAMVHDQALGPLKTLAFDSGVNITLGLPFIRTSVDHGTAMDIAGQGVANPESLLCALRDAVEMAGRRRAAPEG